KRVAVTGGAPVTVGRVAGLPFGASWTGDEIFYGGNSRGVFRLRASGGSPEVVIPPAANEFYQSPQLLPGGDTLLFTVASSSSPGGASAWDNARIVVQSLKTHERKVLIDGGTDGRYVPTGHLLYALGGVVFAVAFDASRLRIRGGAVPIVEGVARAAASGSSMFGVSNTGPRAYLAGAAMGPVGRWVRAWTNPDGGIAPVPGSGGGLYETPRISADGRYVAVTMTDQSGPNVWIVTLSDSTSPRRLTFGGKNRLPVWSPDGSRIVFQSDRESDLAVFSQAADGSGTAIRVTKPDAGVAHEPTSWSPDGASLLVEVVKGAERSLSRVSVGDRRIEPLAGIRSTNPINATFSPDGRWVAYGSNEPGSDAIFVEPFPQTGAKYQISRGDIGHHPVWSRDGGRLFYIPGPGRFASVAVTTAPSFSFSILSSAPRSFVFGNAQQNNRNHDIGRDGRPLGIVPEGQTPLARPLQLNIVLNWTEELKQRVPSNARL